MHVNKVHHVTTINRVAKDLGEDENWLFDVANGMDVEDGVIWVYGVGDDGAMAFTDFGIENLLDLIKIQKATPRCSSAAMATDRHPAAYAAWIPRAPQANTVLICHRRGTASAGRCDRLHAVPGTLQEIAKRC
jgi:hypothetical protein